MPTFTNCSNQQKVEDRLQIDDFSSLWLWTCVPSTNLESIWTNFREHVEDYDAFLTAVGVSYHLNKTLPFPPKRSVLSSTVAGLGEFETSKAGCFLGVWFVGSPGCPVQRSESSRKAGRIRFGGRLQQTNKTTWERICLFPVRQAQWTKKYHSFGGNDSQPAICKCEKKLQLLDVVLCCSQREDDFGWLLHLGSWSNLVQWFCFFLGQNDHMKTEHTMQHRGIKLYEAKCCLGLWLIWLKTKSLQKAAKKVQDLELTLKKWKRNMLLLLIYFSDFFWTYLLTQKQPSILTKA